MPRSAASSRDDGSRSPTRSRPSAAAARSASVSQLVRPPRGARAGSSWRKSGPAGMVLCSLPFLVLSSGPYGTEHGRVSTAIAPPRTSSSRPSTPAALGAVGMTCVGGSVAVSGVLADAPLSTAQAVRYAVACGLLVLAARATGRPLPRPRGIEWAWLAGVACCGLVGFNIALVRGSAHADPALLGSAVAGAPIVLALLGPALAGRRPGAAVAAGALLVCAGAALVEGGGRADAAGVGWAAAVLACEVGFTVLAVPVLG